MKVSDRTDDEIILDDEVKKSGFRNQTVVEKLAVQQLSAVNAAKADLTDSSYVGCATDAVTSP
jgi:hypothetical protein